MVRLARIIFTVGLFVTPYAAFAAGSAFIGALTPSNPTVSVGTAVSFTVIPSGFTNPTYTLTDSFPGGISPNNIDSQGNFSWMPNQDDIGTHSISIVVSDSLNNTATVSQTVTVVSASVSVTSPSPASTVRYGTRLTFTMSSVGFRSPAYEVIDEFRNSSIQPYSTYNGVFSWFPIFQDIGVHRLIVSARDSAGNYATTSQTITIENAPSVTVTQMVPGLTVPAQQTLTFLASTTVFVNPTFTVQDRFYGEQGTSTLTIDSAGRARWTPIKDEYGSHTFTINVTDTLGHAASTQFTEWVSMPVASSSVTLPTNVATSSTTSSGASTQSTVFVSFLTVGSSGKEVTALQQKLAKLGFLTVTPTGYFGPATKRAVQLFQTSVGLSPLGYVGPGTRTALNK